MMVIVWRSTFVMLAAVLVVGACRSERDVPANAPGAGNAGALVPVAAPHARLDPSGDSGRCSPAPPPPGSTITLTRVACYGFCPAYSLEVTADGTVTYNGHGWVRVRGTRIKRIAKSDAESLFAMAECGGFWSMQSQYTVPITDQPAAEVAVNVGGGPKIVRDYPPCHSGAWGTDAAAPPPSLCAIEKAIDQTADVDAWVMCVNDAGVRDYCME
jgi:hypothetical protein